MRQLELFERRTSARPSRHPATQVAAPEPAPEPPPTPRAPAAAAILARRLAPKLSRRIAELVLTDNRSRILSARPRDDDRDDALEVRIHHCFAGAPDEILERVAEFLDGARGQRRRQALAVIRAHFEAHRDPSEPGPTRQVRLDPVGRCYDLRELRDEVNGECFEGRVEVAIGWGRHSRPRRRTGYSIRLGSYHLQQGFVRIHPVLDRPEVPRWVLKTIVHHEMLHAVVPPVEGSGRRRIHPPEFRQLERAYPHHDATERWLSENLSRLLERR